MKHRMRTAGLNKSIAARTSGLKIRVVKKALILGYGTRWRCRLSSIKKLYNKVYSKMTFSLLDWFNSNMISESKRFW